MINIAVIEDEDKAAAALSDCIERYGRIKNEKFGITRFSDAVSFLKAYNENYDLIFMDIMLPHLNGMDAARQLRGIDKTVVLVFVTNLSNFAINGYEVDALDFILKPVQTGVFMQKMDRILGAVKSRAGTNIKISADGTIRIISSSAIMYVETEGHYLVYHTEEGELTSRGTINVAEKQLTGHGFFRCNSGLLINMRYVTKVSGDTVTVGGKELAVSRSRKKNFMTEFNNYLGRNL